MGIVVKPGAGKGKGYVILVSNDIQGVPTITLKDGTVIKGKLLNNVEGNKQYQFPTTLYEQTDLTLDIGGKTQKLKDGKQSYEGGGIGSLQPRAKGSIGSGGQIIGGGGLGGAQQIGGYGVAPEDISAQFPKPQTTFTDPMDFAKKFGQFNLENLGSTNKVAKAFALDNLNTELTGLQSYLPQATALKQAVTASDNIVNQASRTQQLRSTIPDVLNSLKTQTGDAETYAQGGVPSAVLDKGLTLSDRAAAADQTAAGGFGTQSSAARAVTDLMSAKDRIGLSQYGNQLKQSNAELRTNIEVAPTEYSNAGQQVNVMPSISGSQLQQANFGAINAATLISPEGALGSTVQQNQWNTQTLNDFAMSLFNYKVGLSNAVASAGQVSVNTGLAIDQQKAAQSTAETQKRATQNSNTIGAIIKGGFDIAGTIAGFF